MPEPSFVPEVLSASSMSNTFLGNLIEVCFATEDCTRTMQGMVRLGIGPWRVYTFDASTVADREYGGEPADWALKVAFADVGDMAFEIMQPLYGPSIIREFLDSHGEGVHHLAFDCGEAAWDSRAEEFASRGFRCSQAGRFMDRNAFAFFDTEGATTTTFETYTIPKGFVWPEPEEWFPGPPPAGLEPSHDLLNSEHS
ncbi:VOC family protein [Nocardioides sp. NPDC023903]|uniref:VOC family protein n=1 Tax=Nocardioides sp. NPDC023903 TaxID=3157195 RepID=UPI0033DD2004